MCWVTYDRDPPYFCFFGLAKNTLGIVFGLGWTLLWMYFSCYFVWTKDIIQTSFLHILYVLSFLW